MEEAEVDMIFYLYQAVANFCSLNRDPEAKRLPASSDYQGPFRHEFFGPRERDITSAFLFGMAAPTRATGIDSIVSGFTEFVVEDVTP
jgi:hypothetical protein